MQAIEWAAFFAEHERLLTAYATNLVGHSEDARDLIQDVMVNLVRSGAAPTDRRQFAIKAIRNRAIDLLRSKAARRACIERRITGAAVLIEPDRAAGDTAGKAEKVERLLALLSSSQREVVVLRLYASFSFSEIAGILEKPLGTITSLYARSLERMRQACRKEFEDAR